MLIFKRLIHSASRGFPQWVELHYDEMDKLHPPWPLPPAVSGQRPVSRVPAAAHGGAERPRDRKIPVRWRRSRSYAPLDGWTVYVVLVSPYCRRRFYAALGI